MRPRTSPAARGFTLIELAISIALGVIVLGTAAAVMATALRDNRRARVHSELQRDAELASQLLAQEIRQAGLGVPSGRHISEDCTGAGVCNFIYGTNSSGTANALELSARSILVAGTDEIGILGDLPRPDANYNVFGPLHGRNTATNTSGTNRDAIAWHTENNGTCVPPEPGVSCTTGAASTFFPGGPNCNTGTELTCAWASRRIAPAEALQIVDGSGNWSHARVGGTLAAVPAATGPQGLRLAFRFDQGGAVRWANNSIAAGPAGFVGQGWVTTLDRVFYQVDPATRRLLRRQCWGDPDPRHPQWPPEDVNAVPASPQSVSPTSTGSTQVTGTTCIGPETVARSVLSLTFAYADGNGNPLTTFPDGDSKNRIRRVSWTLILQRADESLGPTPVTYTIQGATRIEN
jgi:prepilin-type N-terminal cleavage/methylation domain-containing protein